MTISFWKMNRSVKVPVGVGWGWGWGGEQDRPVVSIPGRLASPEQMASTLQTSLGAHSLTKRPESSPRWGPKRESRLWERTVAHEFLAGDKEGVISGAGRAQGGASLTVRGVRAEAPSSSPTTSATGAHLGGGLRPEDPCPARWSHPLVTLECPGPLPV